MDRREALLGLLSVGAYATLPVLPSEAQECTNVRWYGTEPPKERKPIPRFYDRYAPLKGISTLGRNVFLYKNLQKEIGEMIPHYQGPADDGADGEGDCVAQAAALGCDILAATNIHLFDKPEEWEAKSSVEMIYAGSRVEVGGNKLRGRGGSHGEWAATYLRDYGVLHRKTYAKDGNSIDLTGYHPGRSRKYRSAGVPDWLEDIARQRPVKEITQAQTGQEALDAVSSGNVVLMCSSYAFPSTRDAEGFTKPHLSRSVRRGRRWFDMRTQWWHAMLLCSAILEGSRVGGTILNSHGKWNEGPQPNDLPDGGFNVELQYIDIMVKDWMDCYVLGAYRGSESRKVRKHLLFLR